MQFKTSICFSLREVLYYKKWILAQYQKVGVRNAELEALGYGKTAVSVKYLQLALSRNDRHSAKNSWIRIVIRISTEI